MDILHRHNEVYIEQTRTLYSPRDLYDISSSDVLLLELEKHNNVTFFPSEELVHVTKSTHLKLITGFDIHISLQGSDEDY